MSDEQLIAEIARIWVANGGDADGLAWCWGRIREAVEALIKEKNQNAD